MVKKAKEAAKKLNAEKVGFFTDFKAFITKGNVLDLAVAVVIGGAFNAIVTGLVKNIITPVMTFFTSGVSINEWKYVLREAVVNAEGTEEVAEIAISYGLWLQSIIDFFIIALCIFTAIRLIRSAERKLNAKKLAAEAEAAAAKKAEEDAKAAAEAEAAAAAAEAEKAEKDAYIALIKEQAELLRDIRDSVKK